MRGDRPFLQSSFFFQEMFTPHARGSTRSCPADGCHAPVYPACAGIDLPLPGPYAVKTCLPRMRGDRPVWEGWDLADVAFTPHARGSTSRQRRLRPLLLVYPACAGIDRGRRCRETPSTRLPRMRGDRPSERRCQKAFQRFTPHARGSTLTGIRDLRRE